MGFIIYSPNFEAIKFPVGVLPLDFFISSTEKERIEVDVTGIPGGVDYGFNYKTREGTLTFWLEHYYGEFDYMLLESEIMNFLDSTPYFYVSRNEVPSRAIKISIDTSYKIERIENSKWAQLEVPVKVLGLPFWRTVYTTQDIQKLGYDAINEKFGLADGINLDFLSYTPTTNSFSIWNGGHLKIDPRHFDLSIRLLNATSKGNVTIENLTTGEKFIFYRQFENTHLNIFGSQVLLGNTNWLRESNRKFISLVPGENKIKVSNVEHQGVSFDFPYYFK